MHKRFRNGFTIVELLIVIVVIAILAALVIVAYNGVADRARENVLKQNLASASKSLASFKTTDPAEDYPATLAAAGVTDANDVTYEYTVDNTASPKYYCVTATLSGVSFHVSSTDNVPSSGACAGHGGPVNMTAAGWDTYPIPWSSGYTDHGYGPYYGVYYPSTLHADNSGSLTLLNPLAHIAAQGGVRTYLWCRNTSTNAISTTTAGPTFADFNSSSQLNTVNWTCPAGTVLYALHIGSTSPGSTTNPDGLSTAAKARTWYAEESPSHKPSQAYTVPSVSTDPEGWVTMPIPWGSGSYSDLGYGPYYGVYIANDPAKDLEATQSGILQLNNPYAATRAQGGVRLYYYCKNATTGLVTSYQSVVFSDFNSSGQTREVNWSCPAGMKLFAATISSTHSTNYFPNELVESSKVRYWFSGESVLVYPAYLETLRTMYGE